MSTANHKFDWRLYFRDSGVKGSQDIFHVYLLDANDERDYIEAHFLGHYYPGPNKPEVDALMRQSSPADTLRLPKWEEPIPAVPINDLHPGDHIYEDVEDLDDIYFLVIEDLTETLEVSDEEIDKLFKSFQQIALQD